MSNLKLYDASEKEFKTNGIGILIDVIDPIVTERLNGEFELRFKYPQKGIYFNDIKEGRLVTAVPSPGREPQQFKIYKTQKVMSGYVSVQAYHRAYDLQKQCVSPFTAESLVMALQRISENAATNCPFQFWTDKNTVANINIPVPMSIWSLLGGTQGSILDTYGGEYEFDNLLIKLHSHRGADHGVTICYGKNLVDLQQDRNISKMITGVYPYWANQENELVQLPEKIIRGPGTYPDENIIPLDLSQQFSEKPSEEELRKKAEAYVENKNIGVPDVSLKVEFAQLENVETFKEMAFLERVELGDTVNVQFPEMQVNTTARIVATEYNPQQDRYISATLGNLKASLASVMAKQDQEIKKMPEKIADAQTAMKKEIQEATSWLTNGLGHKVERRDANGNTIDTLYLDSPDVLTAKNVLRIGQSGIGFSRSGINGPFVSAWTLDGRFNADFITAGALNANLIKAGVIKSKSGNSYWDLDAEKVSLYGSFSCKDETGNWEAKIGKEGIAVYGGTKGLAQISSKADLPYVKVTNGTQKSYMYPGEFALLMEGSKGELKRTFWTTDCIHCSIGFGPEYTIETLAYPDSFRVQTADPERKCPIFTIENNIRTLYVNKLYLGKDLQPVHFRYSKNLGAYVPTLNYPPE